MSEKPNLNPVEAAIQAKADELGISYGAAIGLVLPQFDDTVPVKEGRDQKAS